MSQGPVGPVREDLFYDGMVPVVALGLEHHERAVGEVGMVAPGGEQLVLALGGLAVLVADSADDRPGGDGLTLLGRERGIAKFGDLGVGDPASADRLRSHGDS